MVATIGVLSWASTPAKHPGCDPHIFTCRAVGEDAVRIEWDGLGCRVDAFLDRDGIQLAAVAPDDTSFDDRGVAPGVHVYRLRIGGPAFQERTCTVTLPGEPAARFVRGDCNGDGRAAGSVTDAVFLLQFNFLGGTAPPCLAACDADGDGGVQGQVTDVVYLLGHLFLGGPRPPEPYPICGPDPAPGQLSCDRSPCP